MKRVKLKIISREGNFKCGGEGGIRTREAGFKPATA